MAELRQICTELLMQKSTPHENIVSISDCYCWNDELYVRFDSSFECRLWWSTWTAEVWQVWLGKKSTGRKSILHTYVSVFSKQCVWFTTLTTFIEVRMDSFLLTSRYQIWQYSHQRKRWGQIGRFRFCRSCYFPKWTAQIQGGNSFLDVSWTHSRRGIHK